MEPPLEPPYKIARKQLKVGVRANTITINPIYQQMLKLGANEEEKNARHV
jgi:hypothetical protein